MTFTGRERDLGRLKTQLSKVTRHGQGTAIVLSGRRRVGKSRLAQEFCDRSDTPYVIFQATRGRNPAAERADLLNAVGQSSLPEGDLLHGLRADDWNHALRALASAVPVDRPSIVVLDEVPWLVEQDPEFEGALQTVWDRHLSSKPVLLLLIGSDLSVMEALQSYGRPFHGRATPMLLRPLDPYDVATMTGLSAVDAFDAYLITGGFPEVVRSWSTGMPMMDFLRESLDDPLSPLLVSGKLTLLGEFPEPTYTRQALTAIGAGETTFSTIASRIGGGTPIPAGSLAPILATLQEKQVVTVDLPLSTKANSRLKRYRVADQYLRFWLTFLQQGISEAERGRGDLVLARIERAWTSWRGRAIEPVAREALSRLLPDDRWPSVSAIGGWWNRANNPEIDLVGADRAPVAQQVGFVGSIKWLDRPFAGRELEQLIQDRPHVPGAGPDTPMVAVSRSGFAPGLPLAGAWGPEDLLAAWAPG